MKSVVRRTIAAAQRNKASWVPLFPGEMLTNNPDESVACMQTVAVSPSLTCPNTHQTHLIPGFMGLPGNPLFMEELSQHVEGFYVHRLELDLYVRTSFNEISPPCAETSLFLQKFRENTIVRAGLVKQRWEQDTNGTPAFLSWNPIESTPFAADDSSGDYNDGHWLWVREHHFEHQRVRTANFVPQWSLQGDELCSDCATCDPELGFGPFPSLTVIEANMWKLKIRINRRRFPLHFKEGDGLTLFFGWENLKDSVSPDRPVQPALLLQSAGGRAYVSR